jgi:hypothetical protein
MQLGGALIGSQQDYSQYNKKVNAINDEADAINKSTVFKYQMNGLQQQQIQDKATVEEGQARSKEQAAEGSAEAAAASGGVSGNSVNALIRGFKIATGKDIGWMQTDADNQTRQSMMQSKGSEMDARSQITNLKNNLPSDPSNSVMGRFFGAALGIGKSFVDTTTPVTRGTTGGLFGGGGILGSGRQFG